jgi:hypothetical protein
MTKKLLSEPLQIIHENQSKRFEELINSVRHINELTEEEKEEFKTLQSGLRLLHKIRQIKVFHLVQQMHANAAMKPRKCLHKRTKYRMKAWAIYTTQHRHEQGFQSKVLTCRDCGIEL